MRKGGAVLSPTFFHIIVFRSFFGYLESALVSSELHFNLEGIALKADGIEVDGLKHFAAIAFESGRGVVDGNARHDAHIF